MQRVSECGSVVFCGAAEGGRRPCAEAAASPQGWPPPKHLSSFRKFLIANGSSLQAPLASGKGGVGSSSGLGLSEKHFARSSLLAELREIFSLEKV
jgi:hypothetical protein